MSSSSNLEIVDCELICVIANDGLGSKVLQKAKKFGISGGTILLGKGTVKSRLLELLGIDEVRKELVFMASDRKKARDVLDRLDQKLKFSKPNHGIAFTTSVGYIIGTGMYKSEGTLKEGRGEDEVMYQLITVIVEKGNAEFVIEAAGDAGSKGGTVVNARGSGVHETSKLFGMEIEPEKEMVIILSEQESTASIAQSIKQKLKIDEPGNGIIFIQDVNKTYGIYR